MNSSIGLLITFVLHPLLGFYVALKSKKKRLINYGVYMLSFWIGLTFSVPVNDNSDVLRYHEEYENEFLKKDLSLQEFGDYVLYEGEGYDFFKPLAMLLCAKINLPFEGFMGLMGWIFAIFFMRIFWLFYDENLLGNKTYIIFLIFVLMIIPIWYGINNIRFTLVSVLITLYILQPTKKLYVYLTLMSPLIHYGAFVVLVLLLVYKLSKRLLTIPTLLIAFIVFSVIPKTESLVDVNIVRILPEYYWEGAANYTSINMVKENTELLKEREVSLSFHTYFMIYGYSMLYTILPVLLGAQCILDKREFQYFGLLKQVLFIGCVTSVLLYFPSFGRYRYFVVVPAVFVLIKNYKLIKGNKILKLPMLLSAFAALLYSIIKLRTAFDFISIETITGSALYTWSTTLQSRTALIDLIK